MICAGATSLCSLLPPCYIDGCQLPAAFGKDERLCLTVRAGWSAACGTPLAAPQPAQREAQRWDGTAARDRQWSHGVSGGGVGMGRG